MSDLKLYSVNWQDGMLISRRNLKDQKKYFEELIKWHARSVADNYGLVKKTPTGKPALGLNISAGGGRLQVELIRCQALTPDGIYIEINETAGDIIRGSGEITDGPVAVYVGVDSEIKKQVGDPDPSEDLPRVPYMINGYVVTVGQPPNLPEGQYLQIAELTTESGQVEHSPGYFPPCMTLSADEQLNQKAIDFRHRLENLLSLSSRAFMAITAGGSLAAEKTDLQMAFKDTMYQLAATLAASLDELVIGHNSGHPLSLILCSKRIFRVFTTLLNLQPGLKDYLNEKYFTREAKSEVGRFISSVESVLMTEYDHKNIGGQLRSIEEVLGTIRGVLGFLAQTKKEQLGVQAVATESLTYHGRTYKIFDYSSCKTEQVGELCYMLVEMAEPRPLADTVILITKDICDAADWRNMQIRLGINEARGLGETDPVEIDVNTFGNKVALHPQDMLRSSAVKQMTLIFRGAGKASKFSSLGKMDLIIYAV